MGLFGNLIGFRDVVFVHHKNGPNLGDQLCTPQKYFSFLPKKGVGKVAIVGGGTWRGFAAETARRVRAKHKILWGVGVSLHAERPATEINLARVAELYELRSTRDPDWAVDGMRLVPCPSVFHPLCDTPVGTEEGIFLNGGKPSGDNAPKFLEQMASRGLIVGTNFMHLQAFTEAFAKTRRIATNSYHVAYWGLLSGREISIVGYSSKFCSLAQLFDLSPESVSLYRKGTDPTPLFDQARCAAPMDLGNPYAYRERFREMNLDFARELVSRGLFDEIALLESPARPDIGNK